VFIALRPPYSAPRVIQAISGATEWVIDEFAAARPENELSYSSSSVPYLAR